MKNLPQCSTTPEFVNFGSFDKIIEEHIEKVQCFAHRTIKSKDMGLLILVVREWLIKATGCFITVGNIRIPSLKDWFEEESIIQDFDELFLMFKDYLVNEKGIDHTQQFNLVRLQGNLTYILTPFVSDDLQEIMGYGTPVSQVNTSFISLFDKFIKEVTDKFESQIDVAGFIAAVKGDNFEGLLEQYVITPEE